jgi:hypothetical protein
MNQKISRNIFLDAHIEGVKKLIISLHLVQIRKRTKIATTIIRTSIDTTLIPGGRRVYSILKLSIHQSHCNIILCSISKAAELVKFLQTSKWIVWHK